MSLSSSPTEFKLSEIRGEVPGDGKECLRKSIQKVPKWRGMALFFLNSILPGVGTMISSYYAD